MSRGIQMLNRLSDTFIGLISFLTLFLIVFIVIFSNSSNIINKKPILSFNVEFGRIDGLLHGSEVRISGIKVGYVNSFSLIENNNVSINIHIDEPVLIPVDTAAVVETDGLFGSKYIELYAGGEETFISSGEKIIYAQDSIILDDIILQITNQIKGN